MRRRCSSSRPVHEEIWRKRVVPILHFYLWPDANVDQTAAFAWRAAFVGARKREQAQRARRTPYASRIATVDGGESPGWPLAAASRYSRSMFTQALMIASLV